MTGADVVAFLTVLVLNVWGATSVIILSIDGKRWCTRFSLAIVTFCTILLILIRFW